MEWKDRGEVEWFVWEYRSSGIWECGEAKGSRFIGLMAKAITLGLHMKVYIIIHSSYMYVTVETCHTTERNEPIL